LHNHLLEYCQIRYYYLAPFQLEERLTKFSGFASEIPADRKGETTWGKSGQEGKYHIDWVSNKKISYFWSLNFK